MIMKVGSGSASRRITADEFNQYRLLPSRKFTHNVSDSGQWMIASYDALPHDGYEKVDTSGNLKDIMEYAKGDPLIKEPGSTFYVYDRFNDKGYSPAIGLMPGGLAHTKASIPG